MPGCPGGGGQLRLQDLFFTVLAQHPIYALVLLFFGLYPVLSSLVWIATAVQFYWRRERGNTCSMQPVTGAAGTHQSAYFQVVRGIELQSIFRLEQ